MKAFLSAVIVALGMALGAAVILGEVQTPAEQAFTTQGVRL
ncbi:hypothetical protein [Aerophototrophica crusticola]